MAGGIEAGTHTSTMVSFSLYFTTVLSVAGDIGTELDWWET